MIWITLIEVEALAQSDDFRSGEKAFVTSCVAASSAADAEQKLAQALSEMQFHVVAFEDTRPWSSESIRNAPPGLAEMVNDAERSGEPQFGTFHSWENQG